MHGLVWTALEQGKKVSVNIKISYEGMSKRPSLFDIYYEIDGKTITRKLENVPGVIGYFGYFYDEKGNLKHFAKNPYEYIILLFV